MDTDSLNAINESMYHGMMRTIEDIMLIIALFAIAGFVIYLIGAVWVCFDERRLPARRQMKQALEPQEPDLFDLLTVSVASVKTCNHLPSPTSTNPAQ
ncbi:MAG TPA: hypothetical protein VKA70_02615 [Blastocatellia bacterium]|nr:hypothetical protein [Blastocatellia bacterium]